MPARILGRDVHLHAACFDEIAAAVEQQLVAAHDLRTVVFNAHAFPALVPQGAIIYNLENVDVQIGGDAFAGHEIWDFSARNAARWRGQRPAVNVVPVGHHASMERFQPLPWDQREIDVLFTGCMNPRRQHVLEGLTRAGLRIVVLSTAYGQARDKLLARSKLALNMLFYEDGTFAVLRSTHCGANSVAVVSEAANEAPAWAHPAPVPYDRLVDTCRELLAGGEQRVAEAAASALEKFRERPLKLPERSTSEQM